MMYDMYILTGKSKCAELYRPLHTCSWVNPNKSLCTVVCKCCLLTCAVTSGLNIYGEITTAQDKSCAKTHWGDIKHR